MSSWGLSAWKHGAATLLPRLSAIYDTFCSKKAFHPLQRDNRGANHLKHMQPDNSCAEFDRHAAAWPWKCEIFHRNQCRQNSKLKLACYSTFKKTRRSLSEIRSSSSLCFLVWHRLSNAAARATALCVAAKQHSAARVTLEKIKQARRRAKSTPLGCARTE